MLIALTRGSVTCRVLGQKLLVSEPEHFQGGRSSDLKPDGCSLPNKHSLRPRLGYKGGRETLYNSVEREKYIRNQTESQTEPFLSVQTKPKEKNEA